MATKSLSSERFATVSSLVCPGWYSLLLVSETETLEPGTADCCITKIKSSLMKLFPVTWQRSQLHSSFGAIIPCIPSRYADATLGGMVLFALYLGISPVYRVWGVSETELRLFKGIVLAAAIGAVLIPSLVRGELRLPSGMPGPLGFAGLALLSVPGMVQSVSAPLALEFVVDIGFGASMLWCFFHMVHQGRDVNAVLVGALIVLGGFAATHLLMTIASNPDLSSPCAWTISLRHPFGSHYTGWSVSLALFLPVTVLLLLAAQKPNKTWFLPTAATLYLLLIGSQFVTRGRIGMVASILTMVALTIFRSSRILALSIMACCLIAGVVLFDESCARHLKIQRLSPLLSTEALNPATLDAIATGRLSGYRAAVRAIAERPILGHGLGQVTVEGVHRPSVEIHNLWLKFAAYCGVLAAIWLAVMVGTIGVRGLSLLKDETREADDRAKSAALVLILGVGLFASMLQPGALIGSMQYTAVWWAAAGTLLGIHSRIHGSGAWAVRLRNS